MLTRLIYSSENYLGSDNGKMIAGLNAIMDGSNRNNKRLGVTGALLFDTLWFVQILEGERAAISDTLRRIMNDERHGDVTIIETLPFETRLFSNWWMGLGYLRGDNSALYARLGLPAKFDPRAMSGDQIIALAVEIAKRGLDRKIAEQAA